MAPNNFWAIMRESRHVIKPHGHHLLTLALIFFFPISFSSLVLLTLAYYSQTIPIVIFHILYSILFPLLSNCGVISITYSVFRFFYNHPVNLTSAIKSISTSFFPLLATTVVSHLIIFFITVLFGLLSFLLIQVAAFFDLTISYSDSPYVIIFFLWLPHLLVVLYLQVNWTLVSVIVVVESCWGLEPFRRSMRLIKGMRGVALFSFLFFQILASVFNDSILMTGSKGYGNNENWFFVVLHWVIIVALSCFTPMITIANLVVNTVLYIHCKANHGEDADEIGNDYVRLPFPDANVSNVV